MTKLYFRAWLPNDKQMVEVKHILSLDEVAVIAFYNTDGDYDEYMLSECELMQGIWIDNKLVYEGDKLLITNKDFGGNYEVIIRNNKYGGFYLADSTGEYMWDSDIRILKDESIDFEVIGNVYE